MIEIRELIKLIRDDRNIKILIIVLTLLFTSILYTYVTQRGYFFTGDFIHILLYGLIYTVPRYILGLVIIGNEYLQSELKLHEIKSMKSETEGAAVDAKTIKTIQRDLNKEISALKLRVPVEDNVNYDKIREVEKLSEESETMIRRNDFLISKTAAKIIQFERFSDRKSKSSLIEYTIAYIAAEYLSIIVLKSSGPLILLLSTITGFLVDNKYLLSFCLLIVLTRLLLSIISLCKKYGIYSRLLRK
jgi:hypothetical protein